MNGAYLYNAIDELNDNDMMDVDSELAKIEIDEILKIPEVVNFVFNTRKLINDDKIKFDDIDKLDDKFLLEVAYNLFIYNPREFNELSERLQIIDNDIDSAISEINEIAHQQILDDINKVFANLIAQQRQIQNQFGKSKKSKSKKGKSKKSKSKKGKSKKSKSKKGKSKKSKSVELKRLQKKAKKLKVRITKKVRGKRVYKTVKELKKLLKK